MYTVTESEDLGQIGSLRHAAAIGAEQIQFSVTRINLNAPIIFKDRKNVSLYGNANKLAVFPSGYGFIFSHCENVDIRGFTFSDFIDDGVRFDAVENGRITNCRLSNYNPDGDEGISVINGCGKIEIGFNEFLNIKKCILLGTGDNDAYLRDKETLVSIHDNIFYDSVERRLPYGTGKVLYTGNWANGWVYQGVQSFGLRMRQGGKCFMDTNIFDQDHGYFDEFTKNWFSKGHAKYAVTVEDDAKVHITKNNKFTPWWLTRTNNGTANILTPEELSQMVRTEYTLDNLQFELLKRVGPFNWSEF